MLTSEFHSGNKIAEPTTYNEFVSRIMIMKGADQIPYFNKAALPGIDPTYTPMAGLLILPNIPTNKDST